MTTSRSISRVLNIYFNVFHTTNSTKRRSFAKEMIEYAIDKYGDKITMTKPRGSHLVLVKQSPIERELDGGTISFHNL